MAVATFDTLKFSKALREAGVSEKQADAEATVLAEVFSINFRELATKEDLKFMEERSDFKLKDVEQRLNAKIDLVEKKLDAKIDQAVVKLEAKIESTVAPLRSDNILMKWMLGASLSIMIAVAVRLFFFAGR